MLDHKGTRSPSATDRRDTKNTFSTEIGPWGMIPAWVLRYKLSGSELAVYVALRSFVGSGRGVFPRSETVAARAHVAPGTALNAISKLQKVGLIHTTKRRRDDGSISGLNYFFVDIDPKPAVDEVPEPTEGTASTSRISEVGVHGSVKSPFTNPWGQEETIEETTEENSSVARKLPPSSSAAAPRDDEPRSRAAREMRPPRQRKPQTKPPTLAETQAKVEAKQAAQLAEIAAWVADEYGTEPAVAEAICTKIRSKRPVSDLVEYVRGFTEAQMRNLIAEQEYDQSPAARPAAMPAYEIDQYVTGTLANLRSHYRRTKTQNLKAVADALTHALTAGADLDEVATCFDNPPHHNTVYIEDAFVPRLQQLVA